MAKTSARLLRLLSLFQARRDWPAADLAARLGVSERTVRRDIDTLRELGYPIHASLGPGGAYRLGAGNRLPPLLLDNDQAIAVAVALQTTPRSVLGLGEAAQRALGTLRAVMPAPLARQVDALEVTSIRSSWELPAPDIDPARLVGVGTAVRKREVLDFHYTRASGGPVDDGLDPLERVEPHHLVVWSARWYLVAYDLVRDRWQTYRLDRIVPRRATGQSFTARPLPATSVATYVMGQFDRGDTPDHWPCYGHAVLELEASIVAKWAPGGAIVEQLDERRCQLTLGAWSWVGLAALYGAFDAEMQLTGPPELIEAAQRLSRRCGESHLPLDARTGAVQAGGAEAGGASR